MLVKTVRVKFDNRLSRVASVGNHFLILVTLMSDSGGGTVRGN